MTSPEIELPLDTEREYRAIEATLLETARGRWFLAEHSRRSRRIESGQLEDALALLKSSMREPPALLGRLQTELDQIVTLLDKTRRELVLRQSSHPSSAAGSTASGSGQVMGLLKAAEDLHEAVWSLQSRQMDPQLCEEISRQTAAIFTLTARQAQEAQRVTQFTEALDLIAQRVTGALETVIHEARADADRARRQGGESILKAG